MRTTPKSSTAVVRFDSAVDRWLAVLLTLPFVLSAGFGVYLFSQGRADDAFVVLLTGAVTLLVTMVCIFPCRYTFLDKDLSIRCGWIYFKRIPYQSIREVQPTTSWLSGPSLSLRRLKLRTTTATILVSPQDQQGFLKELQARSEHLKSSVTTAS